MSNRLYKFIVIAQISLIALLLLFVLNGERKVWTFPSTTSLRIIEAMSGIRFRKLIELLPDYYK